MSLFIRENLLQYHREYYQSNRLRHIENIKQYRIENKDKIDKLYKKMYTCPICQKKGSILLQKSPLLHRNKVMLKTFFNKWRSR